MKEVNKQREIERARRVSHFYGQIKKEVSEKKEESAQVTRVRPNRPRYIILLGEATYPLLICV